MTLTRAQREALHRVWLRDTKTHGSYLTFRRGVQPYIGGDCVLVRYAGMWLGIERDGYTHS